MADWLSEPRTIDRFPGDLRHVLFVYNCSGHNGTDSQLTAEEKVRTEIRYFPPNFSHLIQPCDSFIIKKLKRGWCSRWQDYKMQIIRKGSWKYSCGKLHNPGNHFFLKLAAAAIRIVNLQRDADGLIYVRNAMIMTGMALNTNRL